MALTNLYRPQGPGSILPRGVGIYYEAAGSDTTDATGDASVDLSATFSAITMAIIQIKTHDAAYTTSYDADSAAAGVLEFRVFTASTGASLDSTAVTFSYFVIGTLA